MNITELHSFKLSDAIEFNTELNPKLFAGRRMRPDIRAQLLRIAADFIRYMGIKQLDIEDIIVTGSNAAYSYTPHSDIDLHIMVDYNKLNPDDVYKELFNAKKNLYNDRHEIKLFNHDVELYVQDSGEPHESLGQYSLMQDRWRRIPIARRPTVNNTAVMAKAEKLQAVIRHAIRTGDEAVITRILEKLGKYRRISLAKGGEFSAENLSYKLIRNRGLLEKLYRAREQAHSRDLSLPE